MKIKVEDVTDEPLCLNLVWVSSSVNKREIQIGFKMMWRTIFSHCKILNEGQLCKEFGFFKPWIHVGENVYLFMGPSNWSPGDISGYLKTEHLDSANEVMVVRVDSNSYIPHQGMNTESFRHNIYHWIEKFKHVVCRY